MKHFVSLFVVGILTPLVWGQTSRHPQALPEFDKQLKAGTRASTTETSRTSWGPRRDKTSFPVKQRILSAQYH